MTQMSPENKDKLAKEFSRIYFNATNNYHFISGGGILSINNHYFFGLNDIRAAVKLQIPENILFDHYDYCLDEMADIQYQNYKDKKILSLRNYYKFSQDGSLERRLKRL